MADLFDPLSGQWHRVSPALALLRRISWCAPLLVLAAACLVVGLLVDPARWVLVPVTVVIVVAAAWVWWWAARNQRAWGYAETDEELVVTSGIMFRRLVAVPYGRMQFVDVEAGPIERALGIARITLHTASAETAATIPGVTTDEAARLRNRLTELGEARGAGV